MITENKTFILRRLSETHTALKETVEGIDLELVIYEGVQWRIRDLLGHIAIWDRVVSKAIKAYLEGSEYVIPNMEGDESDFNTQMVLELKDLPTAEIYQEWNLAREDFKKAVDDIPADQFSANLNFPWGDERGSVSLMINYMIEHNEEHQHEITEVLDRLAS